jgi:inositol polyphosphate-4-phosphatase
MSLDLNEVPLCELSLSCDNLVSENYDEIINPFLELHIKVGESVWIKYGSTEILEVCLEYYREIECSL